MLCGLIWKMAVIVAFSSNLTQQNIVLLKACILYRAFQVFVYRCVNWLSGTCFVKVKVNLDIILPKIIFY